MTACAEAGTVLPFAPPMPELDDIVAVAAAICGTEDAAVTLIRNGRQVVLHSSAEIERDAPAGESLCSRTILQAGLMEVEDARADPRFQTSTFVNREGGIRFYAGVPFSREDGSRIGALCVFDQQPRVLTELQRQTLTVLARQITVRFRESDQRFLLEEAMRQAEAARLDLMASERRFKAFMDCGPFISFVKDADGRLLYFNEPFLDVVQPRVPDVLGRTDAELWDPELAAMYRANDLEVLKSGKAQVRDEESVAPDGRRMQWRSYKFPFSDEAGTVYLGGVRCQRGPGARGRVTALARRGAGRQCAAGGTGVHGQSYGSAKPAHVRCAVGGRDRVVAKLG